MTARFPVPAHEMVRLPTRRDLVRPFFRYRRTVLLTFVGAASAVLITAALAERTFESEMKILVKRERLDTVVSSEAQAPTGGLDVTEAELYAEVELLTSSDLLEDVVRSTGLMEAEKAGATASDDEQERLTRATRALRSSLSVQPVRKTTMIRIAYQSHDPQLPAAVLNRLTTLYLAKHLAVHRPAGAYQFFTEQAERFQKEARGAEAALARFAQREQVVSAAQERDTTLLKLSEFEASLEQTEAQIADAAERGRAVQAEIRITPDRETTQISSAGNVELVRRLRSQILELEIKRSEMLQKFTAQYPPVVQLQDDLARLRQALISAEQTPLRDETTNQNPTHQWLRNEFARIKTEHEALRARARAIRGTVAEYRARARRLGAQSVQQQRMLSAAKEAEDNYQLYRRKQEEARISDALDHTRIANVVVVDRPTVPQSHSPRRLILLLGAVAAVGLSLSAAYLLNVLDPRFRTAQEVYQVLSVPVLAALPGNSELRALLPSRSTVVDSAPFHDPPNPTGGGRNRTDVFAPHRTGRSSPWRTAASHTSVADFTTSGGVEMSRRAGAEYPATGLLHDEDLALGEGQVDLLISPADDRRFVDPDGRRAPGAPPTPLQANPGSIEPATASPIAGLSAEVRQQLVGLVERVFMPLSGEPTRCVGFSAIDPGGASGAITASVAELLSERTTGTVGVVDANLAAPSLHRYFGIENSAGLADALAVGAAPADTAFRLRENLWIVTAGVGQARADASADAMRLQMAKLIADFDYVLVNIEPVGARGDAGRFAAVVDGVILVVDADSARREAGRPVVEILRAAGTAVIGAVLTNLRLPIPDRIYRRL